MVFHNHTSFHDECGSLQLQFYLKAYGSVRPYFGWGCTSGGHCTPEADHMVLHNNFLLILTYGFAEPYFLSR